MGIISTMGPLEQIYAQGYVYRRAVEGQPKLLVIFGVWLIFFPSFLVASYTLLSTLGKVTLLDSILCAGSATLSGLILFRATENFVKRRANPQTSTAL